MSMWGGRFQGLTAQEFRNFNDSLVFDYALAPFEIHACIAWARAIEKAGVLTSEERHQLVQALEQLQNEVAANPKLPLEFDAEDIHGWVENILEQRIGTLARKLHTGRSRNDLVATDMRLYALWAAEQAQVILQAVQEQLLAFADTYIDTVMPGYTHLQRAQPIMVAHWALAYVEMLRRDQERLTQVIERTKVSPLGAGALAGSGMAVDRFVLAETLGLKTPCRNSLDAVSDRDFVMDLLYTASVSMLHISRLSEDVIFYTSGEAGFFKVSDAVSSGSSLMPQKKNPDVFELLRGKTGRVIGHLQAMMMTMKGLPLAYNKDMQEDKEGFFDAMQQWHHSLSILAYVLPELSVDKEKAKRAARLGYSNATDLADYLVDKGVAFRDAHEASGQLVLQAIQVGCALEELPLQTMQVVHASIEQDVFTALSLQSSLNRRDIYGGTAPKQVKLALEQAKSDLLS